jgi:solute:Na+ symporter, SSS family
MPSFELTTWDRGAVREAAPEDVWTIAPRADDGFVPWPGIFTGAFFHGFYYWVANHMVVQKVLAAKKVDRREESEIAEKPSYMN